MTDATSGLRCASAAARRFFAEHYPADYPEPVAIALCASRGFTVGEIPVAMRFRQGGVSSITGLNALRYMVRVILALWSAESRPLSSHVRGKVQPPSVSAECV